MSTTLKVTVATGFVALASTLISAPASARQLAPCPWASGHLKNALMTLQQCAAIKSRVIQGASHTRYKPGVQTQPSGLRSGPLAKAVGAYKPGMGTSVSLKSR